LQHIAIYVCQICPCKTSAVGFVSSSICRFSHEFPWCTYTACQLSYVIFVSNSATNCYSYSIRFIVTYCNDWMSVDIAILSTAATVTESARNFGVVIDTHITRSARVAAPCRTGFYQLGELRHFARELTSEAAKTWRLDCCNSLLFEASDHLVRNIQYATRRRTLRASLSDRDGETTSLRSLVSRRVEFKIACLESRPSGNVGSREEYSRRQPSRVWWSLMSDTACVVPRARNTFNNKIFASAGARLWYSHLPFHGLCELVTVQTLTANNFYLTTGYTPGIGGLFFCYRG